MERTSLYQGRASISGLCQLLPEIHLRILKNRCTTHQSHTYEAKEKLRLFLSQR